MKTTTIVTPTQVNLSKISAHTNQCHLSIREVEGLLASIDQTHYPVNYYKARLNRVQSQLRDFQDFHHDLTHKLSLITPTGGGKLLFEIPEAERKFIQNAEKLSTHSLDVLKNLIDQYRTKVDGRQHNDARTEAK
jgi:hypothetical protein